MYVCDAQTNSIKLLSRMYHCARFLRAIGALYEAFSIHNKAALYETKTTNEAFELIRPGTPELGGGGQEGQLPFLPFTRRGKGAKVTF